MIVQPCTVAEIQAAPEFVAQALEYAASAQVDGMPPLAPDWESYARLEAAGLLHGWSAREEGRVVGYISIIVSIHPRCTQLLAMTEGWFVCGEHRSTGAGLKLLKAAEERAIALTGGRLLVSAPVDSELARALPRLGYREVSQVFFKVTA